MRSNEIATIGKSVVVKGELSGSEDLIVDGEVEGSITLRGQSLTIGPNGRVRANIEARNVIVHGRVDGNIHATERVDLRKSASLTGDIATARISIEDGAFFKGGIDIQKPEPAPEDRSEAASGRCRRPGADFGPGHAAGNQEGVDWVSSRAHRCALRLPACRGHPRVSPRTLMLPALCPYNGALWLPASSKDYSVALAGRV